MKTNIENISIVKIEPLTLLIEGKEQKVYAISNNTGYFYEASELIEIIEGLNLFYRQDDIEQNIRLINKRRALFFGLEMDYIESRMTMEYNSEGLLKLPKANYQFINFDNKIGSVKCDFCKLIITNNIQKGYYTLHAEGFGIRRKKTCSENCAQILWNKSIKNWIIRKGFLDFFEDFETIKADDDLTRYTNDLALKGITSKDLETFKKVLATIQESISEK